VLERSAHLLVLSDLGLDEQEGRARAEAAVRDGSALERYERWISAQGGDPSEDVLPRAAVVRSVESPGSGYVRRPSRASGRDRGA
jgi:thymidine phosphorylase